MVGWFRRAAGWQRLWFVASMLALGLGVLVLPAMVERGALESLATDRARVIADFERPECLPVRATPYSQLPPVTEGAPCREIYLWRKDVTEKLPLVLNHVLFPIDARRREILAVGALKGAGIAALGSALLFGFLFALARRRRA